MLHGKCSESQNNLLMLYIGIVRRFVSEYNLPVSAEKAQVFTAQGRGLLGSQVQNCSGDILGAQ